MWALFKRPTYIFSSPTEMYMFTYNYRPRKPYFSTYNHIKLTPYITNGSYSLVTPWALTEVRFKGINNCRPSFLIKVLEYQKPTWQIIGNSFWNVVLLLWFLNVNIIDRKVSKIELRLSIIKIPKDLGQHEEHWWGLDRNWGNMALHFVSVKLHIYVLNAAVYFTGAFFLNCVHI